MAEIAATFDCEGDRLVGVLHVPQSPVTDIGLLIVVGGPQYRVGSHRQFVLLARHLAALGIPVMRFDYRGMGDSEGCFAGFEQVDADIRIALDEFQRRLPTVRRFVLWGLCDGASASVMYAATDTRVQALVLVNPWVRTEAGLAQSYLGGYYQRRLLSWDFWFKVLKDPGSLWSAAVGLLDNFARAKSSGKRGSGVAALQEHFLQRMLASQQRFEGRTLVLLSGDDLVATEFRLLLKRDFAWTKAFGPPQGDTLELEEANHTFSRKEWRAWVETMTVHFVFSCR